MIRIVVCCLLLAAPAAGDCILRGTVVDGISGKPLPGARVFAKPRGNAAPPAILHLADAAGNFCFEHLNKGDYEVVADHRGYVSWVYGARPGEQSGTVFAIAPGVEAPTLAMRIFPATSLSGTVVDSSGQPLPGYMIYLLRKVWLGNSGWGTRPWGSAAADDRGAFRLASLAPGTYYLRADPPLWQSVYLDENGQPARPTEAGTYYTAALSLERATPITVSPGQDIANLTLTMVRAAPRRISGRVSGVTWASEAHPVVRLVADQQAVLFVVEAPLRPDGSFVAENLYPARYSAGVIGASRYIVKTVNVTAADADGVVLAPDPQPIEADLSVEANGQPAPPQLLLLNLDTGNSHGAQKDSRGFYRFPILEPGRYRVKTPAGAAYVDHVVVEDRARPDAIVDLRSGSSVEIKAVLESANSAIEAHIAAPPSSLSVTLVWMDLDDAVPSPEGMWKTVPSSGVLDVPSLPPGKYRVFAIEGFDQEVWGCPDLTSALLAKSVAIELKPGETRKVEVPLISAADWDAALRKIGL